VADDRVTALGPVRGGELIVDDQLIALGEDLGIGARCRDEARVGGAVVDVEGVVPERSGSVGGGDRRGSGDADRAARRQCRAGRDAR
jgi:hypothetical protein